MEVRDSRTRIGSGMGSVIFQWLPSPGVAFVIPDQRVFGAEGSTMLAIPALGLEASVLLTS